MGVLSGSSGHTVLNGKHFVDVCIICVSTISFAYKLPQIKWNELLRVCVSSQINKLKHCDDEVRACWGCMKTIHSVEPDIDNRARIPVSVWIVRYSSNFLPSNTHIIPHFQFPFTLNSVWSNLNQRPIKSIIQLFNVVVDYNLSFTFRSRRSNSHRFHWEIGITGKN